LAPNFRLLNRYDVAVDSSISLKFGLWMRYGSAGWHNDLGG